MNAEIKGAIPVYQRADGLFAWNVYYALYGARLGLTVPTAPDEATARHEAAKLLARY